MESDSCGSTRSAYFLTRLDGTSREGTSSSSRSDYFSGESDFVNTIYSFEDSLIELYDFVKICSFETELSEIEDYDDYNNSAFLCSFDTELLDMEDFDDYYNSAFLKDFREESFIELLEDYCNYSEVFSDVNYEFVS